MLDSGASHHVTTDLEILSLHKFYDDTDGIVIGDDTGLSITHTDSTILSIPTHTFLLPNVFCVPSMKRNLIYISQFYSSNNTFIKLLPTCLFVNDVRTKDILL